MVNNVYRLMVRYSLLDHLLIRSLVSISSVDGFAGALHFETLKQLPVCGAISMSELSKTSKTLGRTGFYSDRTLLING